MLNCWAEFQLNSSALPKPWVQLMEVLNAEFQLSFSTQHSRVQHSALKKTMLSWTFSTFSIWKNSDELKIQHIQDLEKRAELNIQHIQHFTQLSIRSTPNLSEPWSGQNLETELTGWLQTPRLQIKGFYLALCCSRLKHWFSEWLRGYTICMLRVNLKVSGETWAEIQAAYLPLLTLPSSC